MLIDGRAVRLVMLVERNARIVPPLILLLVRALSLQLCEACADQFSRRHPRWIRYWSRRPGKASTCFWRPSRRHSKVRDYAAKLLPSRTARICGDWPRQSSLLSRQSQKLTKQVAPIRTNGTPCTSGLVSPCNSLRKINSMTGAIYGYVVELNGEYFGILLGLWTIAVSFVRQSTRDGGTHV